MMSRQILALDIGERRIGVAVSDGLGMLAHPLATIQYKNERQLIAELERIITERKVTKMIVGVPYRMKGGASKKTQEVLDLIERLREHMPVTVEGVDERLTTKMAEQALHNVGKKPSRQRHSIDQIAAVYILQSYLDRQSVLNRRGREEGL